MNEIILFATFIILLIGIYLLSNQLKKPILNYTRIIAAIALLVLIWVFGRGTPVGPRILLTGIAITAIWREYFSSRKLQVKS